MLDTWTFIPSHRGGYAFLPGRQWRSLQRGTGDQANDRSLPARVLEIHRQSEYLDFCIWEQASVGRPFTCTQRCRVASHGETILYELLAREFNRHALPLALDAAFCNYFQELLVEQKPARGHVRRVA